LIVSGVLERKRIQEWGTKGVSLEIAGWWHMMAGKLVKKKARPPRPTKCRRSESKLGRTMGGVQESSVTLLPKAWAWEKLAINGKTAWNNLPIRRTSRGTLFAGGGAVRRGKGRKAKTDIVED